MRINALTSFLFGVVRHAAFEYKKAWVVQQCKVLMTLGFGA